MSAMTKRAPGSASDPALTTASLERASADNVGKAAKKSELNAGHRERLRKKLRRDPTGLEHYEILELLLGYVYLRRDTKPLAKELIAHFGSFRAVLDAKAEELEKVRGVGPGLLNFLEVLRETRIRYVETPLRERESLASPRAVATIARARIGHLPHEAMWLAVVDSQSHLLSWECLSKGTVDATVIFPREVIKRVLDCHGWGFFLVHNHPGGSFRPSHADLSLTQQLRQIGNHMNVHLQDHIIVTPTSCYSIVEDGLIDMDESDAQLFFT